MPLTKVSFSVIQVANNVTSTTVGNTTSIPSFTFDQNGVITSASNTAISGAGITANTIANSAFQTGSIENYSRATGLLSGMRNRIINGAMTIDQRNAGANVTISNNGSSFITDRFRADAPADQSMTFQQQTSIVPAGFSYSLKANASTATSNTSNQPLLGHFIEGFNMADFGFGTANAKTITLSFWVRSSLTGTFGVCFENNIADRGYIASYTINSANTFEYKTVTIPGDTSGTWETTNSRGMAILFDLGFGTTFSSAASTTWANVERGLTGGVKLAANTGATWFITGVQLEVGSTATSFDYRPYGTELALCQRYFFFMSSAANSATFFQNLIADSATRPLGVIIFPQVMRTSPSLTTSGTASHYRVYFNGGFTTCSSVPVIDQANPYSTLVAYTVSGGITNGQGGLAGANATTSAILGFSAEL
jgi:hypothetical protein